jgi:signal transduction histidine kinase/ligand-binding sensor domain-containing protein/AraC-like DNA-binding protein/ActR/RegA family two-component response regulator
MRPASRVSLLRRLSLVYRINLVRLLISIIVTPGSLWANNDIAKFITFTTENGLSNSNTGMVVQDPTGYLWIGTHDGLNRFDGYDFEIFRYSPTDTTSLSHNHVNYLFIDERGILWVGTDDGLNKYDYASGSFKRFYPELNLYYSTCRITSIENGPGNCIWVSTVGGLFLLDTRSYTFTCFYHDEHDKNSLVSNTIHSILATSSNDLWIGYAYAGLSHFNYKTKTFVHFEPFALQSTDILGNKIMSLYLYEGKIWIATSETGIIIFDPVSKEFLDSPINNPSSYISSFYQCPVSGRLWICGTDDLQYYNSKTNTIEVVPNNGNYPYQRLSNSCVNAFVDKQGGFWVTGTGLNYSFSGKEFIQYFPNKKLTSGLSNSVVKTIINDNNGFTWIGYFDNGIDVFDRNMQRVNHYPLGNNGSIFKIFQDDRRNIWIGSYKNGLQKFNSRINAFDHITNVSSGKDVRDIAEDSQGNLWLALHGKGIGKYNTVTGEFRLFSRHDGSNWCFALHIDKNDNAWFGSVNGISILNPATDEYYDFYSNKNRTPPFNLGPVNHIFSDKDDDIWIGASGGLYKFNQLDSSFISYGISDGLPGANVVSVIDDDNGFIWVATSNGLSRLDKSAGKFRNFHVHDGLATHEFQPGATCKDKEGKIWIGGTGGLNAFYPDRITDNNYVPPVIISGIKLFNEPVRVGLSNDISQTRQLVLKYHQNVLTFEYVAFNFVNPHKNEYAYTMEGFDKNWNYVGSKREATYTNLNPGEYTFRVKASNNDGIWNEEGTFIKIIILPPFYGTWWFRFLVAFFLISTLIMFYLWRIRSFKKQSLILEQRVYARTVALEQQKQILIEQKTIISDQFSSLSEQKDKLESAVLELEEASRNKERLLAILSHDIKNPFMGIMNYSKLLIDNFKKYDNNKKLLYLNKIQLATDRLYSLLENLLHWVRSNMEGEEPSLKDVNLSIEIESAIDILRHVATGKQVSISTLVDRSADVLANETMLSIVLRNLIHNAIIYSPPGSEITISTLRSNYFTSILIADRGLGIPVEIINKISTPASNKGFIKSDEVKGTGLGLFLSKEYAEKMGGLFSIKETSGHGTTIEIRLRNSTGNEELKNESLPSLNQESPIATEIAEIFEGKTILVVEDDDDIRETIGEIFPRVATVIFAVNGSEALTKAVEVLPDIIITDLMMPGMNGVEFCHKIRNEEKTAHIPVILITGNSQDNVQIKCLKEKVNDFIIKPFNTEILLLKVGNFFEMQKTNYLVFEKNHQIQFGNPDISSFDSIILHKVVKYIKDNIQNTKLGVEEIRNEIGYSRTQFYRKIKYLTNMNPVELLRSIRLETAAQMIMTGKYRINEVAFNCGFNEYRYFSKCFKEYFGMSPTEYFEKHAQVSREIETRN